MHANLPSYFLPFLSSPATSSQSDSPSHTLKTALRARDFTTAFATPHLRNHYAAQYSPARVNCYAHILYPLLNQQNKSTECVMVGAGAGAEFVAVCTQWYTIRMEAYKAERKKRRERMMQRKDTGKKSKAEDKAPEAELLNMISERPDHAQGENKSVDGIIHDPEGAISIATTDEQILLEGVRKLKVKSRKECYQLRVRILDVADWSHVIDTLAEGLSKLPNLALYRTPYQNGNTDSNEEPESIRVGAWETAADEPIFRIHYSFIQQDILSATLPALSSLVAGANLITVLFTLNELYNHSMSQTTQLLAGLSHICGTGTQLLVVDSAGDYSVATVSGKRYPMSWLLHETMKKDWSVLMREEAKWYRHQEVNYPVKLENMRYQIHVFAKH